MTSWPQTQASLFLAAWKLFLLGSPTTASTSLYPKLLPQLAWLSCSLHDILTQILFLENRYSLIWNYITQDAFVFSISLLGERIKTKEIKPDETGLTSFSINSRSEGQPWPRPELQAHGLQIMSHFWQRNKCKCYVFSTVWCWLRSLQLLLIPSICLPEFWASWILTPPISLDSTPRSVSLGVVVHLSVCFPHFLALGWYNLET